MSNWIEGEPPQDVTVAWIRLKERKDVSSISPEEPHILLREKEDSYTTYLCYARFNVSWEGAEKVWMVSNGWDTPSVFEGERILLKDSILTSNRGSKEITHWQPYNIPSPKL